MLGNEGEVNMGISISPAIRIGRPSTNPMKQVEAHTQTLSDSLTAAGNLQNDMFMSTLGHGDPNSTIAKMTSVYSVIGLMYGFLEEAVQRQLENKKLAKMTHDLAKAAA